MTHFCPNLFVPGAAKSGTSSLHNLLNLHPDICMSSIKEPVYWNDFEFNNFDNKKKEWYSNLFCEKKAIITGESTPSYMVYSNFIENIKSKYKFPPKFIFILRNPIDRCFSHYWWMVGLGLEKNSFERAITQDLCKTFKPYRYYPKYYYHFGLYGKWLVPFLKNFGKENIKIITLENLKLKRLETLNQCFLFLGLEELDDIPEIISNKTSQLKYPFLYHLNKKMILGGHYKISKLAKYIVTKQGVEYLRSKLKNISFLKERSDFKYPEITTEQRYWLKSLYFEDIKMLKELTGKDFNEWIDFKNQNT